jgi:ATP synthase F1 subcomplex gamma subunit
MAGAKEIRTQIKSIRNTQKITKAMEKVATSKMRKAQMRMVASRPYADRLRRTVGHLAHAGAAHHPFLDERPAKRVAFLVISSDRGLCGGLNVNLFRQVVRATREWRERGAEVQYAVIGNKAVGFFRRLGGKVVAEASYLGDTPHLEQIVGPVKVLLDAYRAGELDRVFIASNGFVNTMSQSPTIRQIVPVEPIEDDRLSKDWDYIYEPDARDLLDFLLVRYTEAQTYSGVVENSACEQSARMVAMKAASDNAGKIINELQLAYNKARQAAITKELAEIVGGAAAV